MQIVKTPTEILTQKASRVKKFDKKLKQLAEKMIETLAAAHNPEGVGLAAPQVGILKRLFVIQVNADKKDKKPRYQAFINPEIIEKSGALYDVNSSALKKGEKLNSPNSPNFPNIPNHPNPSKQSVDRRPSTVDHTAENGILEGCLSIENIWGFPERSSWVKLRYQDLSGKKHTQKFTNFPAVIVQHEVDHLNGILFTQHILKQKGKLYRIEKDEKTNKPVLVPLDL